MTGYKVIESPASYESDFIPANNKMWNLAWILPLGISQFVAGGSATVSLLCHSVSDEEKKVY
jgi:hypothetical protein